MTTLGNCDWVDFIGVVSIFVVTADAPVISVSETMPVSRAFPLCMQSDVPQRPVPVYTSPPSVTVPTSVPTTVGPTTVAPGITDTTTSPVQTALS